MVLLSSTWLPHISICIDAAPASMFFFSLNKSLCIALRVTSLELLLAHSVALHQYIFMIMRRFDVQILWI